MRAAGLTAQQITDITTANAANHRPVALGVCEGGNWVATCSCWNKHPAERDRIIARSTATCEKRKD
jgi:hypothetical protein